MYSVRHYQYTLPGFRSGMTCRYASFVGQMLLQQLSATSKGGTGPSVPPMASQLADSMAESDLLAAAAAAIVDSPNAMAIEGEDAALCHRVCRHMHTATIEATMALMRMAINQQKLQEFAGAEGRRVGRVLLRATRHVAVRRLQVALLDRLAAHAGMRAALQVEGEEGPGQQQRGQGGSQADGWEGSSGAWWLVREEARRGQILGMNPGEAGEAERSQTAGWLELYHANIVTATMMEWGVAGMHLAEGADVPAAPPPVLKARLAARAAEALCQLYRGKGLRGAYAPAPGWHTVRAEVESLRLVLIQQAGLPMPTAHACLPYRLEAAGWAAAVLSDATAATVGRLAATTPNGLPLINPISTWPSEGTEMPERLSTLVQDMVWNGLHDRDGFVTLPAAAQDDVRRRMFRCGLAASLDHTLRLLYSAEDSQQAGAADLAIQVSGAARLLIQFRMLPLLPPTEAPSGGMADSVRLSGASDCSSGCGSGGGGGGSGGGSSSDGSSSVGGSSSNGGSSSSAVAQGGEPADPLGLLFTLSKRAAMYTRALEALSAHGDAHAQGLAMQQVMSSAGDTLALLHVVVFGVQEDLRPIIGQARDAAAASMAGRGAANAACRAADGACVDEAHEALALAARAACNLAATLAWQVAAAAGEFTEPEAALYLYDTVGHAVRGLLACMEDWCSYPLALPTAQLLACQPHRLLAAACALAAALPTSADVNEPLRDAIGSLVSLMSVHETFNGRMRSWLAEFAAGGAASSDSTDDAEGDACAGCLAGPLQSLQRAAAGVGAPGASGSSSSAAGQAAAIAEVVANIQQFLHARGVDNRCWNAEALTPFGSSAAAQREGTTNGCGLPPLQHVSAPPGPLPPPLVPPPSRAGALPRLYVCGNPRCGNFGCEGEWALRLKQCGGCRAVRYCGADCQRAHWREGHRSECKAWAVPA